MALEKELEELETEVTTAAAGLFSEARIHDFQQRLAATMPDNHSLVRRTHLLVAELSCRSASIQSGVDALNGFERKWAPLDALESLRIDTARIQTGWILRHCVDTDSALDALRDHPLTHYHEAVSALAWGMTGPARAQFPLLLRQADGRWPADFRAACAFSCAVAMFLEGSLEESRSLFDEAATTWRDTDHREDCLAAVEDYRGRIAYQQGNAKAAGRHFRLCLDGWSVRLLKPHSQLADATHNLALALEADGDSDTARVLQLEALGQREQVWWSTHPDIRQSLKHLACLHWSRGEFEEAWHRRIQWWQRHAEAGHPVPPDLGAGVMAPADLDAALTRIEELGVEFEEEGPGLAEASCLLFLRPTRKGLVPELFPRTDTTDTLGIPSTGFPVQGTNTPGLSTRLSLLLHRDRQLLEQMQHTGPFLSEKAILGMQRLRRRSLDRVLSYCASGQLPAAAALQQVAQGRGLLLEELPQRRRGQSQGLQAAVKLQHELLECEARLIQSAFDMYRNPDSAEAAATCRAARLRRHTLSLRLAQTGRKVAKHGRIAVDIQALRDALGPGEVMVSFVRFQFQGSCRPERKNHRQATLDDVTGSQPAYLAFIIRPDQPAREILLGTAEDVDERIADWRKQIRRLGQSFSHNRTYHQGLMLRAGQALRILIWDPLQLDLESTTRIYLVLDGDLAGVPFGALPVSGSSVLQDLPVELRQLTREQDLLAKEPTGNWRSLLCVGHSQTTTRSALSQAGGEWCALPHSTMELDTLVELWNRARQCGHAVAEAIRLDGTSATRRNILEQAPGKDVIHLATHGVRLDRLLAGQGSRGPGTLFDENPLLASALLVSASKDEAPVLTGQELASLSLESTRLVVLSACDSGGGTALDGVGMLGLQRACQVAGARFVVVSLWPVEDTMSARWMGLFYSALLLEQLSPPEAATMASRTIRESRFSTESRDDPGSWGAFICVG